MSTVHVKYAVLPLTFALIFAVFYLMIRMDDTFCSDNSIIF